MKLWPNPRICSQMSEAKFCPDQKENSAINHRRAGEGGDGGGKGGLKHPLNTLPECNVVNSHFCFCSSSHHVDEREDQQRQRMRPPKISFGC